MGKGGAHALRKVFFWSIRIDGVTYEYDVVIDRGQIHKRERDALERDETEIRSVPYFRFV